MVRKSLEHVTAKSFLGLHQFPQGGDAKGVRYYASKGGPYTLEFSNDDDIICLVLGDISSRTKFNDDPALDLSLMGGSINFHPKGGHFRVDAHDVRYGFVAFSYSEEFRYVTDEFNVERLRRAGNQNNLRSRTIKSLVGYMRERMRRPEALLPLEYQFIATEALLEAVREVAASAIAQRGTLSDAQFKILNDYIDENLDCKITCADLAVEIGLPVRVLFEGVRSRSGRSLYGLVVEKRIRRAREMLLRSDTSIAEIAVACGFCSQQHLTGIFSRKLGVTPLQLRMEFKTRTSSN